MRGLISPHCLCECHRGVTGASEIVQNEWVCWPAIWNNTVVRRYCMCDVNKARWRTAILCNLRTGCVKIRQGTRGENLHNKTGNTKLNPKAHSLGLLSFTVWSRRYCFIIFQMFYWVTHLQFVVNAFPYFYCSAGGLAAPAVISTSWYAVTHSSQIASLK